MKRGWILRRVRGVGGAFRRSYWILGLHGVLLPVYLFFPSVANGLAVVLFLLNLPIAVDSQVMRYVFFHYAYYLRWEETPVRRCGMVGPWLVALGVVGCGVVLWMGRGLEMLFFSFAWCALTQGALCAADQPLRWSEEFYKGKPRRVTPEVRELLEVLERGGWGVKVRTERLDFSSND